MLIATWLRVGRALMPEPTPVRADVRVTMTLPGSSPAASRCIVGSTSSSPMSTGSINWSSGSAPDASSSSAGRKPAAS